MIADSATYERGYGPAQRQAERHRRQRGDRQRRGQPAVMEAGGEGVFLVGRSAKRLGVLLWRASMRQRDVVLVFTATQTPRRAYAPTLAFRFAGLRSRFSFNSAASKSSSLMPVSHP